jgi:hypothetical protein
MRHESSTRQIERRYERALAALQAIASIMGDVVFRVEDYRRPHVADRRSARDKQREKSGNPGAKRAGRDR